MLSKDVNDLLTRTGPGTPMGDLFRQYWLPALLVRELPENDCPPVRVALLSERLIAFRDSSGRYGLIDEFCAHRGVSLWFGRNEENGLRCPYHGWKFGVDGQCVDIPSEPAGSTLCQRIKLTSYPLVRLGDILWTYMGPAENQPPKPAFEFAHVPPEQSFTSKRYQECNWLQALEGGIDSSHVSWLHRDNLNSDPLFKGAAGNKYNLGDARPQFKVVENEGGLFVGARRNAGNGHYYWRITPWVMPCFTMVPPRGDHPVHGHFWVPIDDEHCWAWSFDYHATRPLTHKERAAMEDGKGIHCAYVPGTFIPRANKSNDYLMDREAQKAGRSFSGVDGIAIQDASIQESMGPIADRSTEHLVATDRGIIMARRRLRDAVTALRENGERPPGVDPAHHLVRSAAVVLPADKAFEEVCRAELSVREGMSHASV